ncbi:MAG: hypothetical protein E7222_01955 [Clostridiales bacterium]|nr:hypothetical protein [Clostridiales bacterium]
MIEEDISKTFDGSVGNDIGNVYIDSSKEAEKRMKEYLGQIHNPYCFQCGSTVVRVSFNQEGKELKDLMLKFFSRLNGI